MTYVAGYLNSSLNSSFMSLRRRLSVISTHKQFLSEPSTNSLCQVIDNLVELVDNELRQAEINPFLFGNIVMKYRLQFEGGEKWENINKKVDQLVTHCAASSAASAVAGVGLIVLGAPFAAGILAWLGGSGYALYKTKKKWNNFEEEFIQLNNEMQEKLTRELKDTFNETMIKSFSDRLAMLIDLYDESLLHQIEILETKKKSILDLQKAAAVYSP